MLAIWIKIDSESRFLPPGTCRKRKPGFPVVQVPLDARRFRPKRTYHRRRARPARDSFGYYIRKYKLDELPQLINVFTGDMSLVGPRPEVRKYVDLYTPEQMHVLDVRPGITDPASIRYRNENELLAQVEDPDRYYVEVIMQDKLQLNLEYVEKQSFRFDLQLIFKTFSEIIRK